MTTLHIIYDPRDRIKHDPEMNKAAGIKVAIMSISDELTNDEIEDYVSELGTLLLEQVRLG